MPNVLLYGGGVCLRLKCNRVHLFSTLSCLFFALFALYACEAKGMMKL